MLDYKLAERGGKLVKVDKFFPKNSPARSAIARIQKYNVMG